jgi:hypothetical protein
MSIYFLILLVIFAAGFATIWRYQVTLIRHWREPMLKYPVVIIESDDWGPGPAEQAGRLVEISAMLSRYGNPLQAAECPLLGQGGVARSAGVVRSGRCPVMTIGVVLGAPDAAAIQQGDFEHYQRVTLADSRYRELLTVFQNGVRQGVFALQLHGMEHLWPPTFMRLAQQNGEVRRWLEQGDHAETETLPPAVQSRWIDGSTLPSQPLDATAIATAVREEVTTFREIFGQPPTVAVPPTFIWNRIVERAWAAAGIEWVMTPGRRYTGRNAQGQPASVDRQMLNGESGDGGARYLVRDIYFEPILGHRAEQALTEIRRRWRLGRPALLEMHRSNFLSEGSVHQHSLQELERLLDSVLREWPQVRFMSTEELGQAYRQGDSELFEQRLPKRVHVWLRRLATIGRLQKLAWIAV